MTSNETEGYKAAVIVNQTKETLSIPYSRKLIRNDTTYLDFQIPCPLIAEYCPYPCCCCCILPRAARQQCAMKVLYYRFYVVIYTLIIGITLTQIIYDLTGYERRHNAYFEPLWLSILDCCCVALILFDILIQV